MINDSNRLHCTLLIRKCTARDVRRANSVVCRDTGTSSTHGLRLSTKHIKNAGSDYFSHCISLHCWFVKLWEFRIFLNSRLFCFYVRFLYNSLVSSVKVTLFLRIIRSIDCTEYYNLIKNLSKYVLIHDFRKGILYLKSL